MKVLLFILLLNIPIYSFSQGIKPYTLSEEYCDLFSINEIPIYEIPKDSIKEGLKRLEEGLYNSNSGDEIAGFAMNCNINYRNNAMQKSLENGDKIFLLRILTRSKYVYGINFIIDEFKIPNGSEVYIYELTSERFHGPIMKNSEYEHKKIGSGLFYGIEFKELFIEYFEPLGAEYEGNFIISQVAVITKKLE